MTILILLILFFAVAVCYACLVESGRQEDAAERDYQRFLKQCAEEKSRKAHKDDK